MWIFILVVLAVAAGAWADHMYGARTIRTLKVECKVLEGTVEKLASLPEEEFTKWKARFAEAKKKLEVKL